MSYILDALKKADHDRRVRRLPTLGSVHVTATPKPRRLWPWVAGGALAVNVIVLALIVRVSGLGGTARHVPPAATSNPSPPAAAPTVPTDASRPTTFAPPAGAEGSARSHVTKSATAGPPNAARRDNVRTRGVADRAADTDKRGGQAASGASARGGAELKLDVLVYANEPAERSAWINGQRYVEGQRVHGRLTVEKITPDAVVLSADGHRVVLRQ